MRTVNGFDAGLDLYVSAVAEDGVTLNRHDDRAGAPGATFSWSDLEALAGDSIGFKKLLESARSWRERAGRRNRSAHLRMRNSAWAVFLKRFLGLRLLSADHSVLAGTPDAEIELCSFARTVLYGQVVQSPQGAFKVDQTHVGFAGSGVSQACAWGWSLDSIARRVGPVPVAALRVAA